MRKNSIKNIRINAEVQRELSRIIQQEIKDPRIHPMTTVVMAEVTPDLKYCKAYISVLGNEEAQKSTMEGLKNAKPYIRRMLASSVNLRNTPELTFVLDQSIEYGVHMTGLITGELVLSVHFRWQRSVFRSVHTPFSYWQQLLWFHSSLPPVPHLHLT